MSSENMEPSWDPKDEADYAAAASTDAESGDGRSSVTPAEQASVNLCAMRGFAKNQAARYVADLEDYEVQLLAAAKTGPEMTAALADISKNTTDSTETKSQ